MGDDGNRDRRRDHEADGEDTDRASVRPQVPYRREEGGEVDQRRQDGDEDDLWRERQARDAGNETEPQAAEDEEDRVRNAQHRREDQQHGEPDQQGHQDELVVSAEVHGTSLIRAYTPAHVRDLRSRLRERLGRSGARRAHERDARPSRAGQLR